MSLYRFLNTSKVADAASVSNSAALSRYSATLRTLPRRRRLQTRRLQPLVQMPYLNALAVPWLEIGSARKSGGTITLHCLREDPERYRVAVADDGVGLPEGGQWPVPER
jgi:hypothetical protein